MAAEIPDVLGEMFAATQSGDMVRFRTCFEPTATIWRNTDERELSIDKLVDFVSAVCAQTTNRRYENRRSVTVDNVTFVQHTILMEVRHSGQKMRCLILMRVDFSKNGLIDRIEEYFDSRAFSLDESAAPSMTGE